MNKKILNKCPICGDNLEINYLCQYSEVYRILKNGTISKRRLRKDDNGSMECNFISCSNNDCNFTSDCDWEVDNKFIITQEDDGKLYIEEL